MDVDSTISSGRSTPVMMNGQGVPASSAKSIAYNCCWDHCHACFSSSPDLADHIRSIHVDGQRGGVFVCLWKGCKVYNTPSTSQSWLQRHMLTHSGDKPFKVSVIARYIILYFMTNPIHFSLYNVLIEKCCHRRGRVIIKWNHGRHQLKTKVVHLSKLPKDTALLLDPNIYR
uniref:AE binding protein 2 n=1 Tax=Pavo cristatus TaxID=9049 RepID=A0A8C9L6Z8_PAVCR